MTEMSRPLRVCGLDPSLTSFGGARVDASGGPPELFRFKTKLLGHPRLDYLLDEVTEVARGCDVAVVEGVLAGMPGAEAHLNLAGLHWLVRHHLWGLGVPYAVVTPSTRMKWLTGKGRVEKGEGLAAAIHRFGSLFPPVAEDEEPGDTQLLTGDDTADALTLAAMCRAAYGQPLVKMPADRELLLFATKFVTRGRLKVRVPVIDWPTLDMEALNA